MKHLLVVATLLFGIYWLGFKKSDLDSLLVPVETYAQSQVGERFIEPGAVPLPTTPDRLAESGVTTVVYFRDDACSGCRDLDRDLAALLRVRPDVAVRKVAISPGKDGYSEAIRKYRWRIYMSPCVLIYGQNGKLIAADDRTDAAGYDLLMEWIRRELTLARGKPSG
jgi:hypothetical protein